MAKTEMKIPVSRRAVIQRINRKLREEDLRLQRCRRTSRWWRDLGDHFVVDINRNHIVDTHVDVESYATEIGVLQPFEQMVEAGEQAA